jgi:dUTP pyrophosphatase
MTRVKIVKLNPKAILPEYQTEHSSGMDLHACIDVPQTLQPFERVLIPTGLAIELPAGLEAQIRARSGLSIKNGITMVNGVGTIDSDYRGEVGMSVINLGNEPFVIEPGMRVAQMIISSFERIIWDEAASITNTQRSSGGFGSTGTSV